MTKSSSRILIPTPMPPDSDAYAARPCHDEEGQRSTIQPVSLASRRYRRAQKRGRLGLYLWSRVVNPFLAMGFESGFIVWKRSGFRRDLDPAAMPKRAQRRLATFNESVRLASPRHGLARQGHPDRHSAAPGGPSKPGHDDFETACIRSDYCCASPKSRQRGSPGHTKRQTSPARVSVCWTPWPM